MTIWNLGSINIDYVYQLPHLPEPGETLSSTEFSQGLGGKGANMSVAAARAGSHVAHIGAIGAEGRWTAERLAEYGVDTREIEVMDGPTGHAIIMVDANAENSIVLLGGANTRIEPARIDHVLSNAATGDYFLTQNETSGQVHGVSRAAQMGLRVAYAAAPFDAEAVQAVLPHTELLFLNEVEADQLRQASGKGPAEWSVSDVIVTLGSEGSMWFDNRTGNHSTFGAHKVKAIDTTGAGDTFTGYVLAGLDQGQPIAQAIETATRASALMVMRAGAADVIPDLAEVRNFDPNTA